MKIETFKDPKRMCVFIFGQEMKPCPKCRGYNIKWQTPIKLNLKPEDGMRQLLGKWARAVKAGETPLEGPVYLMCFTCFHKGPSLDCGGRTREEIGSCPVVAREVKRLWNEQHQENI